MLRFGSMPWLSTPYSKKWRILLATIVLLWPLSGMVPGRTALADRPPSQQAGFQRGISFAAWWPGQYQTTEADLSLQNLASTGANWISLIATAYQDDVASTEIVYDSHPTPTDAELIHSINQAHSLGLQVMLKPHLDLRNEVEGGPWRGDIGSAFSSEAEWSAWFASYRTFIEHYATLAETYGADQFCIGTELLGTTHRESDWRTIVAAVRAAYSGPIVYAALHGGEEVSITWWDAVDYIGVDAYYQLSDDMQHHPTVEEFEAAWEEPRAILDNLAASWNRPILLTEIGYRSQHGCGCHPWDSWAEAPIDLAEQAYAYEAAFRQLYDEPWLGGIFWWMWRPDRFKSGPCDDGFSPYRKPAEHVLRAWYGGAPIPPAPQLMPDHDAAQEVYGDLLRNGWQDWSWGGTVDWSATGYVYAGDHAAAVTLDPYGSLSLQHAALSLASYHWLEFYLYNPTNDAPSLQVMLETNDGSTLPPVPVNYCPYVNGGAVEAQTWTRIRIPIRELNPADREITRINVQNLSGAETVTFWLDEIRLLPATEPTTQIFLPHIYAHPD